MDQENTVSLVGAKPVVEPCFSNEGSATAEEAEAMVLRGLAHIEAVGLQKAVEDFLPKKANGRIGISTFL